ncbi:MAG: hypothetical protein ACFFCS_22025 [Candidatus Hodarchaeota archaeon]
MPRTILTLAIKGLAAIVVLYTVLLPVTFYQAIQDGMEIMTLIENWAAVAGPLIIITFILQGIHVARPDW